MSMTKIRGNTQILEKSVTAAQLADDAKIALGQLAEGVELLKRDGSVALTGDLNANGKKVVGLANGVATSDAATMGQLQAAISALPNPMEFKGAFPADVPAMCDVGDAYVVTEAATIGGVSLKVGQLVIAKDTKDSGVAMDDFVIVDRQDQVLSVAGRMGDIVLKLGDITDVTVAAAEVNRLAGVTSNVQAQLDAKLDDSQLITDATLVAADDVTVASSKAVKVYTDAAIAAEQTARTNADAAMDTRITDLETKVTSDVSKAVTDEVTRATTAEGNLQTAINTEVDRAKAAEKAVSDALAQELVDRGNAVGTVQTALDNYKTSNDNALANEVTRATNAEGGLQTAIAQEVTDRTNAVAAEATRATNAEGALQTAIDTINTALAGADVPVDEEVPVGVVDGANKNFALAFDPKANSVKVFLNGMRQHIGLDNDFTVAGKVITFVDAPQLGDTILVDYRK